MECAVACSNQSKYLRFMVILIFIVHWHWVIHYYSTVKVFCFPMQLGANIYPESHVSSHIQKVKLKIPIGLPWNSSAKLLDTFWYLWLTWSSWEQSKQIQESPQELYKLITLYLGATSTSEDFLFKLGLLTFYLLFSPFLAWFWVNIPKRKHKWVQVI